MRVGDHGTLRLRLGSWIDTLDTVLPDAITIDSGSNDLIEPDEAVKVMYGWDWTPWQYEVNRRVYFANGSAEGVEFIISALPSLKDGALVITTLAVATELADRMVSLVQRVLHPSSQVTFEQAAESARGMLIIRVGLSQSDLKQISADQRKDGSFVFLFEDGKSRQHHLVVVASSGIAAHANMEAIEAFLNKHPVNNQSTQSHEDRR